MVEINLPFFGNSVDTSSAAVIDPLTGRASHSYGRWAADVSALGEALRRVLGLRRLVMVFADTSAASLLAIHGGLSAETVVTVADARVCGRRRQRLVAAYLPEAIAESAEAACGEEPTDYQSLGYAAHHERGIPDGLNLWLRRRDESTADPHPALALMLSTSGSTGSAKYVRLAANSIIHNARAIAIGLELDPSDVGLANLPLAYTYGLSIAFSHFAVGAAVGISNVGVLDPRFIEMCDLMRITSIAGIPFSYVSLRRFRVGLDTLTALRQCTQAGGKLATDDIRYFHERLGAVGKAFRVMYGQTEATARISIMPRDVPAESMGGVGWPVMDSRLWIGSESLGSEGEAQGTGEVVFSGPGVMMGYATHRDDVALGDVQASILRTGDLGRIDDHGFLHITGRLARFAKIFGKRIDLDQIQASFVNGGVAVVDVGDDRILVAAEDREGSVDANSIKAHIQTGFDLPASAIRVVLLPELPRTNTGKVDYASLRTIQPGRANAPPES